MNIKNYLMQGRRLDELIKSNKIELQQLREMAESLPGVDYSKEKVQTSPAGDNISNVVSKIIELDEKIKKDIEQLILLKADIRELINSLPDNDEKLILRYRYINMYTFEEIAEEIHMSLSNVYTIHGRALKHLRK